MKIIQLKQRFEPITLTIETREEAEIFVKIFDTLETGSLAISDPERRLIDYISDAFTNEIVKY